MSVFTGCQVGSDDSSSEPAAKISYTVKFDANGGSGEMKVLTAEEGTEITLTANAFTREGCTFSGWNTAADGNGTDYADKSTIKLTADITLYAQWNKVSYTVKFDANGGSGEMKSQPAEAGSEIKLAANAFTREGYTFSGWNTKSDGSGTAHTDGAKITLTADITLFAQWTEIGKVEKVAFSATGEIDYNEKITLSCGTDGAAIYYLLVTGTDAPTAEQVLSSKQKYSEPLAITENAVIAAVAVKDGMKDSEIATATFTVKTYTVTFETEHGTAPAKIEDLKKGEKLTEEQLNALEDVTGYKFDGWFNGETQFTAGTEITSDITLTAKWTPNTYTVTFIANGGEGEMETQIFSYGIAQELSENAFTKTNYTFIGWAISADGDTVYSDKQSYTTGAENITLYARWTATQYSITYNNVEDAQNDNPADYSVESETITLKEISRTGYTFGGWFKEDSFATKVTEIAKGSGGDVALYAKWTANTYTVTFNANGGVGSMGTQTFSYGTEQALLENAFSKDGYVFAGWAKSADGNAVYQNKRNIQIEAEDMTFYAVWWKWDADEFVLVKELESNTINLYVCTHEVTRAEYKAITGKDSDEIFLISTDGNAENNPAIVTWYASIAYCNRRSLAEKLAPCYRIKGSTNPDDWGEVPIESNEAWNAVECDFTAGGYRLPKEAEWEYAALGGEEFTYAGSNDIDEVAWHGGNSTSGMKNLTHEIKTKKTNGFGLYDMTGNVSEWCWDFYMSRTDLRCIRGGGCRTNKEACEVRNRQGWNVYENSNPFGLCVVRTAE